MSELFELDEARIRELAAEEKCTVSARAEDFFDSALQLLVLFLDEYHWVLDGRAEEAELSVLQEHNDALYADILPDHYGESFANPAYCAIVNSPSAVALSSKGNQLTAAFVVIFSRKGWPAAIRNCEIATIAKLPANTALVNPNTPVRSAPITRDLRNPNLSITYDAGMQNTINMIM